MAFLINGIKGAIMYVTPPLFEADIDTSDIDGSAIAGNLAKICTITINIPDYSNFWRNDSRTEINSLRPTVELKARKGSDRRNTCNKYYVDVILGEDDWISENKVRFDLSLRVKSAGIYVVDIKFSRSMVHVVGESIVIYAVLPAEPRSIELIRKEPVEGHGEGDSIYRGGKVRLFLKVEDEYQNTCEKLKLNFDMTQITGAVTLISTEFDNFRHHHVVTVRCDQTGMASFDLALPTASLCRHEQVNVIPPPVSASKSSVPNLDEIERIQHVAGVPFKVKLVLRDIFGNAVPYEERETTAKQVGIKIANEEDRSRTTPSLRLTHSSPSREGIRIRKPARRTPIILTKFPSIKVSSLGQHSEECELEVTPFRAGVGILMSLNIAGNEVGFFPTRWTITPAAPRSVELIDKEPVEGHGEDDSIYRGGKVRLFIKVKDEYQNTCGRELNFDMTQITGAVTLISTEFDDFRHHHVVTVRCDQTGMASFDLSLPTASLCRQQVKVIPPPVSASKSFVPNLDEIQRIQHVAGVPFKVKLVLRDIFGNAVPSEERETTATQVDIKITDEVHITTDITSNPSTSRVTSLGHNSDECELDVTPSIAGAKWMSLSLANQPMKDFPIPITVVPGPLTEIKITSHNPSAPDDEIVSYPNEQRAVVVEATDEQGNVVSLDPNTCYLEISGEESQGDPTIVDGTTYELDDSKLKFSYTFERFGAHGVSIKLKDTSQTHVKVPSVVIQVRRPPIDSTRSEVKVCQEEPIFTGDFRPLQLQLLLYDRTSEKYEIEDDEIPNLKVKVDSRICHHVFRRGNQPNEVFLVLDQIEEGGVKDINVKYKDQDLCNLQAEVVGVIPYDEEEYIQASFDKGDDYGIITCTGLSRKFILGDDYANINNINRVLNNGNDLLDFIDETRQQVIFRPEDYSTSEFDVAVNLLSLLVEGAHHYRGQARRFDREREEWKAKATNQYRHGNHEKSQECKAIKEKYGQLMDESNRLASDAVYEFYNYNRPEYELDLHGQLVVDEVKLENYRQQLLRKKNMTSREVDGIIERERHEGDEAIRLLKPRLTTLKNKEPRPSEHDWLEIIDGAGHHSREMQKIRPKVEKYLKKHLKKHEPKYIKANKGALLITFSEYTGKEPCYGNFYCEKCEKAWVSRASWKGYYQLCYRCDAIKGNPESRCLPFKRRSVNNSRRRAHRRAGPAIAFTDEDHIRLCQKCQELGRDCSMSI